MNAEAASAPPLARIAPGLETNAVQSLRRHGRTFYFAGKILGRHTFENCARLYRFCRTIDDIADFGDDPILASRELNTILHSLSTGEAGDPRIIDFLDLAREQAIDLRVAAELIKGVRGDVGGVRITDESELIRYSYRVAGTVGLMMCSVLGVRDPRALPHAIDLGIAMQLTNIARDVAEDARNDRVYLPDESLKSATLFHIANGSPIVRERLKSAVRRLLNLANDYYQSGEAGLAYLPLRARLAILVASRTYAAIGTIIAARDFATWRGRAVVNRRKKRQIALRTILEFFTSPSLWRKPSHHNGRLHQHLGDLPWTHSTRKSPTP